MSRQRSERWLRCAFIAAVAVVAVVGINTLRTYTRSQERVWSSKGILAATDIVNFLPPQDNEKRLGFLFYFKEKMKRFLSTRTSKQANKDK